MTTQKFKVVGITTHNGNTKVRFTDDMCRRVKQFAKGGASRIDFVELPVEMTKIEALKHMLTLPEFKNANDQATIEDTLVDKEKEARKGTVRVKSAPSLANIAARPRKNVTVADVLEAVKS
jgi:hypothetical protein